MVTRTRDASISRFLALAGPFEGQVFDLGPEPLTVGRQSSNRLQLKHESVSRRHCVLDAGGGGVVLRDLDSSCGTFVNGVPVRERTLEPGNYVKVGDTILFFLPDAEEEAPAGAASRSRDEWMAASTVELPFSEARYLRPEQMSASPEPDPRAARDLAVLLGISNAAHEIRDTKELARKLSELVFEIVPAERVAVLFTEGDDFVPAHAAHRHGDSEPTFVFSRTLARRVLDRGLAVLSHDVVGEEALAGGESLRTARIRSLLCVPLVSSGHPLGVLWADTRERRAPFDARHLELLTAAACVAAMAFDNTRRTEELEAENRRLKSAELEHEMIGESPAMARILELVARVAPTDLTVLVVGESGTGKELVARALHHNSPRSGKPFIAINCATLSETLLESELFGHEKGAFTGALGRKPGKLELAHEGTLFLDEVGEVPPALQAKLLRALEEREFERVGGTRPIRVDVRIVAATNRDLEAAIGDGTFRRDLYHRLNVFSLPLPPLRERRGDIPLLASHFAVLASRRLGRRPSGFTPAARRCLAAYEWPGNVRELRNAVERAVVLSADGLVRPEDLPEAVLESTAEKSAPGATYHAQVNEAKRRILRAAITAAGGKPAEAAQQLGLNRTYLHRLLSNLDLRDELER